MPTVNFKSIESFSSEDPNYPASNLLKPGNKKWKCCEVGAKNAVVVIRLEEPVQINGMDIGNEHSAFVEVLVARSGPNNPNYTEILLSTKFMNPIDSRNSTAPNRVQFFNKSAFVPSTIDEKWDLVKIICTQPFNSRVKYGLTFVTLHTAGATEKKKLVPEKFQKQIEAEANKQNVTNVLSFGRFKLREDSPDSDGGDAACGSSSVFSRWKEKLKPNALNNTSSVSALLRDSATPEAVQRNIPLPGSVRSVTSRPKLQRFDSSDDEQKTATDSDKPKKNRNSIAVLYDKEDEQPDKKINLNMSQYQSREQPHEIQKDAPKAENPVKNSSKLHEVSSSKFKEFLDLTGQTNDRNISRTEKRETSKKVDNPQRTSSNSISYDRSSTSVKSPTNVHTPLPIDKNYVPKKRFSSPTATNDSQEPCLPNIKKARTTETVAKSAKEKEKLVQYKPFGKLLENVVLVISGIQNPERGDIRNKALAMGAKYKPDWDSSCTHLICAYKNTPKYNQVRGEGKIIKKEWIESCYNNRKRFSWRKFAMETEEANATDSEDEILDISNKPQESFVGNVDVEEEAVMIHELPESDLEDGPPEAARFYDLSTEEEGEPNGNSSTGSVGFFKGKTFYLDPDLGAVDMIKLEKYISAYGGAMTKVLQDEHYVITRNNKHKLPPGSRSKLVKPLWVYECNEMECLIPIQRYVL